MNPPPVQKTPKYVLAENAHPQWHIGIWQRRSAAQHYLDCMNVENPNQWKVARVWVAVEVE